MITFKIKGIKTICGYRRPDYGSNSPTSVGTHERLKGWNACSYGEQLYLRAQRPNVHTVGASFAGHAGV